MSEKIQFLVKQVKSKNQINQIPEEYVEKLINKYFLTRGDIRKEFEKVDLNPKNKIVKQIVKDIRKEIGESYGCYLTNQYRKKLKFLEEKDLDELLKSHKSTRERIDDYNFIYEKIFSWYEPKCGIIDIACGFNPISFVYIEDILNKKLNYLVFDLNFEDSNFLNMFFEKYSLNGIAKSQDITDFKYLDNYDLNNYDLVFLFKAIDSIETNEKNSSKKLLEKLSQNYIVVSFPTKSLVARKDVKTNKRNWFYKFLEEKNWNYKTFEIENEMFFLIMKNDQ